VFPRKSKIGPDRVRGPSVIRRSTFKCKHAESRVLTESYETELHMMLCRVRIKQQLHTRHQSFSELHFPRIRFVAWHLRVDKLSAK